MRIFLVLFSTIFLFSCSLFVAGSYGNAEFYEFQFSSSALKQKINVFKKNNPEYTLRSLTDSADERGNFYSVYFYFNNKKAKVHCVIVLDDNSKKGKIGLTGVSFNENNSGWKQINTAELTKEENKEIKKMFETEILDILGKWN